jgi:hypothetical protein
MAKKLDVLDNIEETRNTQAQLDFYAQLSELVEGLPFSRLEQMRRFPVFSTRQDITSFLERYEIFKLIHEVPGCILECGVAGGFGLMAFAHFASIFEPYHYLRRIIGFDTFSGFPELSEQDKTSKAAHMKSGGLNHGSYDILQEAIQLHDANRALGHIAKVELVKGDISQTLPVFLEKNPSLVVGLLYLDMDLYRPTADTLRLLIDRIPKGGIIAFDELNHPDYPGETIAVREELGIASLRLRRLPFSSMLSYAVKE